MYRRLLTVMLICVTAFVKSSEILAQETVGNYDNLNQQIALIMHPMQNPLYSFGTEKTLMNSKCSNYPMIDTQSKQKPPVKTETLALEFLCGGACGFVGSIVCGYAGYALSQPDDEWFSGLAGAAIGLMVGNIVGSSLGVYWVGTAGDHTGSYKASLLGSIIGIIPGIAGAAIDVPAIGYIFFYGFPTLGGMIGFNHTRRYESSTPSGTAVINIHNNQLSLSAPYVYLQPNPTIPNDWIKTVECIRVDF